MCVCLLACLHVLTHARTLALGLTRPSPCQPPRLEEFQGRHHWSGLSSLPWRSRTPSSPIPILILESAFFVFPSFYSHIHSDARVSLLLLLALELTDKERKSVGCLSCSLCLNLRKEGLGNHSSIPWVLAELSPSFGKGPQSTLWRRVGSCSQAQDEGTLKGILLDTPPP